MTVKSPFYNKPSTATSVDSCHKCPLEFNTKPQDSSVVPTFFSANQVQSSLSAGFEQAQATETPSNNTTTTTNSSVVEPSSSSAAKSDIGSASVTSCSNCGTTTTPLWRRSPQGETICNACGLYLKARNTTRPPWLKRNSTKRPAPSAPIALAPAPPMASACVSRISPAPLQHHNHHSHPQQQQQPALQPAVTTNAAGNSNCTSAGEDRPSLSCANCNTTTTPLWRRDEQGNTICNACGLYYKLHNVHRPMAMKRSIIKRRKRVTVSSLATHHHYSSSDEGSSSGDDSNSSNSHKRKLSHNGSIDESNGARKRVELPGTKYVMRPLLPHQPDRLDPVEPDAFQKHLPSPPMKPITRLLNPESRSLPSLPSLPSPPLTAQEMFKEQGTSSSVVTAAAALATVSALLNPTQRTHQMLEAHRHELQREVSNLTSLLSRTTAMLQNLDQVMAVTGKNDSSSHAGGAPAAAATSHNHQPNVANALMSLFALAAKENNNGTAVVAGAPATPPYSN